MSIHSMTAFGAAESSTPEFTYRCEIKTLNSRFIDVNVRLPRLLNALEHDLTKTIKAKLHRGKVDLSLELISTSSTHKLPQLNLEAIAHYQKLADQIATATSESRTSLSVYELLRLDGVLESQSKESVDDIVKKHRQNVLSCLELALTKVVEGRAKEGASLDKALRELISSISKHRQNVQVQGDSLQQEIYTIYRNRLEALLKNFADNGLSVSNSLPEDRILGEIAILTDKSDIAEELTRLETHEGEFLATLDSGTQVGRKLDFLCQEMHREVNTMSNKLTHTSVAKETLAMKQAIERIRQQVQNIE